MISLRELQRHFAHALVDPGATAVCALVEAGGIPPERRVQVYRNNFIASLCTALEAVFPVARRLVGEDFFGYAARRYVREVPSICGDLHAFGESFPAFLARWEEVAGLVYLPDVTRLEWAYHRVYHAAEAPSLGVASLADIPSDQWPALCLLLHPACAVLRSPYPVLRIWQVNQEDWSGAQEVSLDEGGCQVLVRRQDGAVELMALSEGEFCLLGALAAGHPLEQAVSEALAVETDFDLGAVLETHFRLGTFVALHIC